MSFSLPLSLSPISFLGTICSPDQTEENWTAIMSFCDRVRCIVVQARCATVSFSSPPQQMLTADERDTMEAVRAIGKRLQHKNPRCVNFAITVCRGVSSGWVSPQRH